MDPIGPGNHERAWNDPPKFAFNSSGTGGTGNPSGRRRLLNKRVPVPIGPQTTGVSLPPPLKPGDGPPVGFTQQVGPPPVGPPPVGPPPVGPPKDIQLPARTVASPKTELSDSDESKSSQEILRDVETYFNNSLEKISGHIKDNAREEILKRFEVMKSMWLDDKLNDVVQNRMVTLIRAIDEGNFDNAWSIHQGLIVDFTSMCSPWMIGIKTLITECRNQKQKAAGDEETNSHTGTEEDLSKVPIVSPLDISSVVINDTKNESSSKSEVDEDK